MEWLNNMKQKIDCWIWWGEGHTWSTAMGIKPGWATESRWGREDTVHIPSFRGQLKGEAKMREEHSMDTDHACCHGFVCYWFDGIYFSIFLVLWKRSKSRRDSGWGTGGVKPLSRWERLGHTALRKVQGQFNDFVLIGGNAVYMNRDGGW